MLWSKLLPIGFPFSYSSYDSLAAICGKDYLVFLTGYGKQQHIFVIIALSSRMANHKLHCMRYRFAISQIDIVMSLLRICNITKKFVL